MCRGDGWRLRICYKVKLPRSETDLSWRLGSNHLSNGCEVFPVATDGCEDGGKPKGQIVRQTQTRLVDARLCVFISPHRLAAVCPCFTASPASTHNTGERKVNLCANLLLVRSALDGSRSGSDCSCPLREGGRQLSACSCS